MLGDKFDENYVPTIFSSKKRTVILPFKTFSVNFWDISGSPKFAQKRGAM